MWIDLCLVKLQGDAGYIDQLSFLSYILTIHGNPIKFFNSLVIFFITIFICMKFLYNISMNISYNYPTRGFINMIRVFSFSQTKMTTSGELHATGNTRLHLSKNVEIALRTDCSKCYRNFEVTIGDEVWFKWRDPLVIFNFTINTLHQKTITLW